MVIILVLPKVGGNLPITIELDDNYQVNQIYDTSRWSQVNAISDPQSTLQIQGSGSKLL